MRPLNASADEKVLRPRVRAHPEAQRAMWMPWPQNARNSVYALRRLFHRLWSASLHRSPCCSHFLVVCAATRMALRSAPVVREGFLQCENP